MRPIVLFFDLGNGMKVPETVIEKASDALIVAIAKEIPEEYLCMAVVQEVLERVKNKVKTIPIAFFQRYLEEHMI